MPVLPRLRAQVVHADANGTNVLVEPSGAAVSPRIAGFIDFGDMVHTPLANDVAVLLASVVTETTDPVCEAAEMVAGYDSETPLGRDELSVLLELWLGRLLAVIPRPSRSPSGSRRRHSGAGAICCRYHSTKERV